MGTHRSVVEEVRGVCLELVSGKPPQAHACEGWTAAHLSTVVFHGLGPWLYHSLGTDESSALSLSFRDILRREYLASSLASLSRESFLKVLLGAFESSDIPVVLLKGAYLGLAVYESPRLRPMADVDLLVPVSLFDAASEVLCSLGCRPQFDALDDVRRESLAALTFLPPRSSLPPVDLHRELRFMDHYQFHPDLIWNDVQETSFHGHKVFVLSRELNFIHTALHSFQHEHSMRDWLDMRLIATRRGFDWDRLLSLARSLGVMRPLAWILTDLSSAWAVPISPRVEEALYGHQPRWFEDFIIRGKFRYLWRFIGRLGHLKGPLARLKFLRLTLLPRREYRTAVVGTSRWSVYLMSKIFYFVSLWKRS